jgi:cyanophycinase
VSRKKGPLIIIGGREERECDHKCVILREVARQATKDKGRVLIVTVATNLPDELAKEYITVFKHLGVPHLDVLDIRTREEASDPANVKKVNNASVVFFTGGDQLRITSQIGGSPVFDAMLDLHNGGGTIAGTSAGAAAVPDTMLISGPGEGSIRVANLGMAPGLGLLKGFVVDSHFAERGRLGRLLGAVAQNPRNLGLGIDENTAVIIDDEKSFRVLGSGGVYVIDGTNVSYSSLSEENPQGILSIFDLKLHILGEDDAYDLAARRPAPAKRAATGSRKES